MLPFRQRLSLDQRTAECARVRARQAGYVPTILQAGSRECPRPDREKYLLPEDMTGAQLAFVLRRHLRIEPAQALFLHCGGRLVPAQQSMRELVAEHRDEDGFLYVSYAFENAFG